MKYAHLKNIKSKLRFSVICFALLYTTAYSQPTFQKYIETPDISLYHIDMKCSENACYVISTSLGEESFYFPNGIIITKLNTIGQVEWSKKYYFDYLETNEAQTFLTKNGNIIIFFRNRHTYDYTLGESIPPFGDFGLLMIKISPDGQLIWDINLDAEALHFNAFSIAEMSNRDYALFNSATITRLRKSGEVIWEKQLLLEEQAGLLKFLILPDNSMFLVGQKIRGEEFPDDIFNTILLRVSQDGEILWSKVLQDFRPWELDLFPNGDVLLTGHRLRTATETRFIRFSPEGTVRWAKHLPVENKFEQEHSVILDDGSIASFINRRNMTGLVKLNGTGDLLWARSYLANKRHATQDRGKLLDYTQHGSLVMLNNRFGYEGDLIVKTDVQGKLDDCYTANWCIETLDFEPPAMQNIDISTMEASAEGGRFVSLNNPLTDVDVVSKDYCAKISVPSPYFIIPDSLCVNAALSIDSLCQDEADNWLWKTDGRSFSSEAIPQDVQFETAGLHELTHIIETNSCRDTFSRALQIVNPPAFNIGQDTVLCEDEPLLWNIAQNNLQNYTWGDSLTGAMRTVRQSNTYTAFAENTHCQVSDSRTIEFISDLYPENPIDLGVDTLICEQLPLMLTAAHPEAANYLWEGNSTKHTRTINEAGFYYVEAVIEGCLFTDEIVVETEDCAGKLYIPTAFSPNGDGQNDFFEISSKYVEIRAIQIFNRWGVLLYEGNEAWNGEWKGQAVAEGLYVYIIEYVEPLLGNRKWESGEVILLR